MQPRLSEAVLAFATRIDLHRRLVFGAAFRVLGDARRADGVTERVFAELLETGLSRVRPSVPHWLLETTLRESVAARGGLATPAHAETPDEAADVVSFADEPQSGRRWTRSGAKRAFERLSAREHPSRG